MTRSAPNPTARLGVAALPSVVGALLLALALPAAGGTPVAGPAPAASQQGKANQVDPGASLVVDAEAMSFETPLVKQGVQLSHTFEFRSGGKAPLVIRRVVPNCGCIYTAVRVRRPGEESFDAYALGDPIPPGSAVRLRADVDTVIKQDRSALTLQVVSNASAEPTTFLYTINVEPRFNVSPATILFGDVRREQEYVRELDIRSTSGERVRFVQEETTRRPLPDGLSFDFGPVAPDAEGRSNHWKLKVRLGRGMKEGPGGYRFLFVSDVPMPDTPIVIRRRDAAKARGRALRPVDERFSVNLFTNYRVLGDLEVSPGVVSFGQLRAGQSLTRTVKLVATKPGIDLSGAKASIRGTLGLDVPIPESLSVETRPLPGEAAIEATVRVTDVPASFKGTIRCELFFESGYEGKPSLSVPITGVVL